MRYIILVLLSFISYFGNSQSDLDKLKIALLNDTSIEEDLRELTDEIGGRVTGSLANEKAVEWGLKKFQEAGVKAWKHAFEMPTLWIEGMCEGEVNMEDGYFKINLVSKYKSPPGFHSGDLVHMDGLESDADLNGKYVIVEQDLCLDIDGLFAEYDYATRVEMVAREKGAKGILFMSSRPKKLLYRFLTMEATDNEMPQWVVAREDANRIIRLLKEGHALTFTSSIEAITGEAFTSHNVIAEIPGTTKKDEVVIIGAHIDSWALGTGANDNGCNVAMMIDIARQMKTLNIQPERTIRFALWNGEEQGYFGSLAYTQDFNMDQHKLAISIDIGSGAILGFFTNGREELVDQIDELMKPVEVFGPYSQINLPIVGTDNFDFMLEGVPNLVGRHAPQFYGPNYHASSDTYDKVDLKQLKINSAIVASVILGYANSDYDLSRQDQIQVEQMIQDFDLEFTMRMFNVWEPWVNGERGRK